MHVDETPVQVQQEAGRSAKEKSPVANTPAGANASANLYGLIETAKANAVEPYQYLAHLFAERPQRNIESGDPIDDLLPWNVVLPDPTQTH
jgi:hypothetical protein